MTSARRFGCRAEAVTAARLWVRERLSDKPREVVEAAELLTSELAANCVRHARSEFEVTIDSRGPIRVEVTDSGEGEPRVLSPALRTPSGRGLRIVDQVSDVWGITARATGKTVWFTLSSTSGRASVGKPPVERTRSSG
jgi:anti-sigma regulatory factor (Ser/Thr protein kinase)